MNKVMIDPGHHFSNKNKGQTGYYEYLGVWIISIILQSMLRTLGLQADLTRQWDEDPDLRVRGIQAQEYDLFISEHTNAFNGTVRGVEVFYDFEKEYDKANAAKLSKAVSTVMGNPDRGAKVRTYTDEDLKLTDDVLNYYGVIRNAAKTNCRHIFLIESGYHDNPEDEAFLKEYSNLRRIALAQAFVICEILEIKIDHKDLLQKLTGIDDNTSQYLEFYRYGGPLKEKLIKPMINQI
ncbi:MAG: N-acetylmuramoyl-L-alanine amidase family protein [Peptococcales bacterium]|jgi:N-acetylmuramoyl-L-alanine amidase